MKWMISLPEPSIMPNTVSSGSGMPSVLIFSPSSRERAVIAADMPEQPDPATSTSHSYVSLALRSLPVMWASLLQERTFGLGDRTEGVLALHGLDDLQIVPGLLRLLGRLHLGQ